MKRLVLCFLFSFTLCSCGGGAGNDEPVTTAPEPRESLAEVLSIDNFPWEPELLVGRFADGRVGTDMDLSALMPFDENTPGVNIYYVSTDGTETNSGLSWDSPLDSPQRALRKPNVDVVLVAPGIYAQDRPWGWAGLTRDVVIKGFGETAIVSLHRNNLVWDTDPLLPNVYRSECSGSGAVYDSSRTNELDDFERLPSVGSPTEVALSPGSWYSNGETIWVRLADDRVPDDAVRVYLDGLNGYFANSSGRMYVENIEFHGGTHSFVMIKTEEGEQKAYFKNCKFKYATSGNGLCVLGTSEVYLQECEAARNFRDGVSYHASNGFIPKAFEIDIVSRDNGYSETDIDNGSTMHDGGSIIRVGGHYFGNRGPNIADVNASYTWNVGGMAYGSLASSSLQGCDFQTDGKAWLYLFESCDSPYGLRCDSDGEMYLRDVQEETARVGGGMFLDF